MRLICRVGDSVSSSTTCTWDEWCKANAEDYSLKELDSIKMGLERGDMIITRDGTKIIAVYTDWKV
jgi:hypothetical protein